MRQLLDEADGVGQEDFLLLGQHEVARRRVERREELVLGEDLGAREPIQQRRLARIGVADEGDERDARELAAPAVQVAVLLHGVDLCFEVVDARVDAAAVDLEFRLAGAARADTAAEAREHESLAAEARQVVLELRELDLQLALPRAGALCEDVEDQCRAVDDLDAEHLLEIVLLRRRELVVEDQERRIAVLDFHGDLGDFAAPEEEGGVGLLAALDELADNDGARRVGQPLELGHRLVDGPERLAAVEACEQGALRLILRRLRAMGAEFLVDDRDEIRQVDCVQRALGQRSDRAERLSAVLGYIAREEADRADDLPFSIRVKADGGHAVEAQAAQRGQVGLAEACVAARMCVDTADARELPLGAARLELRQVDRVGVADGHLQDFALTIQVDGDFAAEQMRDFEHLAVEFVRRELANRHGLLVEPLEPLDDVLFDILDVSIDLHRIPHGVNRG